MKQPQKRKETLLQTKQKSVHIDRAKERELIELYQDESKDQQTRNDALAILLDVHNPYVQHLAAKAFKQFNRVVEFEDLIQQARIGLIKAAMQFDLTKIVEDETSANFGEPLRFLTYAHKWMIAQMQDAWHHAHAVHIPAHILRAIHFKKIEEKSALSPKAKTRMKLAKLAMNSESLDALTEDFRNKENRSSNNFEIQFNQNGVRITDPTFEEGVANMFSPEVQKAIEKLTETEWIIFKMKAGLENGIKYPVSEIAKKLKLTADDVDKMFKRAKRILSKHIVGSKPD